MVPIATRENPAEQQLEELAASQKDRQPVVTMELTEPVRPLCATTNSVPQATGVLTAASSRLMLLTTTAGGQTTTASPPDMEPPRATNVYITESPFALDAETSAKKAPTPFVYEGETPTTAASPGTISPVTAYEEDAEESRTHHLAPPSNSSSDRATQELIDLLLAAVSEKQPEQQQLSVLPNFESSWMPGTQQKPSRPPSAATRSSAFENMRIQPRGSGQTQSSQPPPQQQQQRPSSSNFDLLTQLLKSLTDDDSDINATLADANECDPSQWKLGELSAGSDAPASSSNDNDGYNQQRQHQPSLDFPIVDNSSVSDLILASLNATTLLPVTTANGTASPLQPVRDAVSTVLIRNLFTNDTTTNNSTNSYLDLSLFKGFKCQAEELTSRIMSNHMAAALAAAAGKPDGTTPSSGTVDHMKGALAAAAAAAAPPHDRKNCPFYHSNRDRRRLPVFYNAEQCEAHFDFDSEGSTCCCARGDNCERCHNRHELLYHPKIYKQRFCSSFKTSGSPATQCHRGRFCAFAHSREEIKCSLFTEEEELFPTAEFFMRRFKTFWCPYGIQHDWHGCLYAHTYQDCRRSPDIEYGSEPCPYWQKDLHSADYHRRCPLGAQCPYAHGSKEQLYHPAYYKTMPCADYKLRRDCPRGTFCAFYHDIGERRKTVEEKAAAADASSGEDNEIDGANGRPPAISYDYTRPVPAEKIIFLQHNFMAPPLFNLDDFEAFGHYSRGCSGESPSATNGSNDKMQQPHRPRRFASNQRAGYSGRNTSNSHSYHKSYSNYHQNDQGVLVEEIYANRRTPNEFLNKDRLLQLSSAVPLPAAGRRRSGRRQSPADCHTQLPGIAATAPWQLHSYSCSNSPAYPAMGLGCRGGATAAAGERRFNYSPPSNSLQSLSASAASDGYLMNRFPRQSHSASRRNRGNKKI